jgi:hypothetical protein
VEFFSLRGNKYSPTQNKYSLRRKNSLKGNQHSPREKYKTEKKQEIKMEIVNKIKIESRNK